MHVDVHGCVNGSSQVVLHMVLFAVHNLHLKSSSWHGEDWAIAKIRAELLPI